MEKLESLIPGFRGYKQKELLREDDRLVRDRVRTELEEALKLLEEAETVILDTVGFEAAEKVEMVIRRVRMGIDRVKYTPAGYSGLFDRVKIRETTLTNILNHDLQMIETAINIKKATARMRDLALSGKAEEASKMILEVYKMSNEVLRFINEREKLFLGEV